MNRHSPELQAILVRIDEKIASARASLESEMTDARELPKHRAKLAALKNLKTEIEEMFNEPQH